MRCFTDWTEFSLIRLRKTNLMHNLFLVYLVNLYMFRAYLGPSSGGTTVCIQQLVLIVLSRWLSVVVRLELQSTPDNRQSSTKNNKQQQVHTYGCTSWWWAINTSETCRGVWGNILKINCTSISFIFKWIPNSF